MRFEVHATTDAAEGLDAAGAHLRVDPVRNNVILTLLESTGSGDDRRFWWVTDRDSGDVVGALYQGPLVYPAVLSVLRAPCADAFARGVAASIAGIDDGPLALPLHKVRGIAGDVADFAGAFCDHTHRSGQVDEAFRMLACDSLTAPDVAGRARTATAVDLDLLAAWTMAFVEAIGDPPTSHDGAAAMIGGRLDRGNVVVWEVDGEPVAMASTVESSTAPVARIGIVYTPDEHRRQGYAAAVTAAATAIAHERGRQPMLLTQLSNPTSNAVYRSIGYRTVAEETIYRFGDGA